MKAGGMMRFSARRLSRREFIAAAALSIGLFPSVALASDDISNTGEQTQDVTLPIQIPIDLADSQLGRGLQLPVHIKGTLTLSYDGVTKVSVVLGSTGWVVSITSVAAVVKVYTTKRGLRKTYVAGKDEFGIVWPVQNVGHVINTGVPVDSGDTVYAFVSLNIGLRGATEDTVSASDTIGYITVGEKRSLES